jgi:hypothetical protein
VRRDHQQVARDHAVVHEADLCPDVHGRAPTLGDMRVGTP